MAVAIALKCREDFKITGNPNIDFVWGGYKKLL